MSLTAELLSHCRFLLAKFQLDHVLSHEDPRNAINSLDNLPTDMESAYGDTLDRIEKDKARTTALKVLSWVYHARRHLRLCELVEVITIQTRPPDKALDPDYFTNPPESLVQTCQGLVEFDQGSEIVRFTHFTVQEFLQQKYLDNLLSEVDIAKVCLTYLTFDVFEQGPCSDKESLNQRVKMHTFYEYAVQFWASYTRGRTEEDPDVQNALLRLFKSSSIRAALRQQQLLMQTPTRKHDEIWELSAPLLSMWMPIHIIANEGLVALCTIIFAAQKKDSIGEANNIYALDNDLNFQNVYMGTIELRDSYGRTPVGCAAENGHKDVVEQLLLANTDVNAQDEGGRTALHEAVGKGQKDVVEQLLLANADVNAQDKGGWTALHWAALNGHTDVVEQLLLANADVNAQSEQGMTALHWTAGRGQKDVADQLLLANADVNAQDKRGWTALHWAAWKGQKDVVEQLLLANADVNAQDEGGEGAEGRGRAIVARKRGRQRAE